MSDEGQPQFEQSWPSQPAPIPAEGALVPPAAPAVVPHTSGDAIAAFVLALVSWAACPIVFAIVALVFAFKADRTITASGGQVSGGGLNLAAKLLAWINLGFWLALILIGGFITVVLLLAGAGSTPPQP
ncbi:MAG: hypothetical protein PHU75_07200 [Candidatus Nanopelagicales bacterium]|nr:hypothetical protein [Candidatus Nanopelagicales bacterium]